MNRAIVLAVLLVSLSVFLIVLFSPALVLHIRDQETHAEIFCINVSKGEEIFYASINSIYNTPVTERWRVREDGAIQVVEVAGSAAVMEYYRLDDYQGAGYESYRGAPKDRIYRDVLMRVGARGQQRLTVRGQEIALYQMVAEGAGLEIGIQSTPRLAACL